MIWFGMTFIKFCRSLLNLISLLRLSTQLGNLGLVHRHAAGQVGQG